MNFKDKIVLLKWSIRDFFSSKKAINIHDFKKLLRSHQFENQKRFNYIESKLEMLSQNQFENSGLKQLSQLNDRITSVLMEWDKVISEIQKRLEQLEKSKGGNSV